MFNWAIINLERQILKATNLGAMVEKLGAIDEVIPPHIKQAAKEVARAQYWVAKYDERYAEAIDTEEEAKYLNARTDWEVRRKMYANVLFTSILATTTQPAVVEKINYIRRTEQ